LKFFNRPVAIESAENPNLKSDLEIFKAVWTNDKKASILFLISL
jgi:hypothetical protein